MVTDKSIYQIALTQIKGIGITLARTLMQTVGDEEAIFKESTKNLEKIPRISRRLISEIHNSEVMKRSEEELKFIEKNAIDLHFFTSPLYPQRLTNCIDAPILIYSKGNVDFNRAKTISIVGTRHASEYGKQCCEKIVKELSERIPDLLIISGLAFGIDICSHRAALKNNLSTIAVLGHGLDRIYPAAHRKTAVEMLSHGALISEFPSKTSPEGFNFVKRNRIVAGMADAVIVVESANKGGSLITADIANSYFREVFAIPGRVTDIHSVGCNKIITENKAVLFQDIESFLKQMGWNNDVKTEPKQRELFIDLNEDEKRVVDILYNKDSIQVNLLALELNTPVTDLFFTLLELEMKNVVKALPGGLYKLI